MAVNDLMMDECFPSKLFGQCIGLCTRPIKSEKNKE
jgi:hypothetical protein